MAPRDQSRMLIADQRGNGSYLRASWHADRRVVVISHWRGDVCTATTAVGVADLPRLISLLVSALADRARRVAVPDTPRRRGA